MNGDRSRGRGAPGRGGKPCATERRPGPPRARRQVAAALALAAAALGLGAGPGRAAQIDYTNTTATATYYIDAAINRYDIFDSDGTTGGADRAELQPYDGVAPTPDGFEPNAFGNLPFRQGQFWDEDAGSSVATPVDRANGWSGSERLSIGRVEDAGGNIVEEGIGFTNGKFQFGLDVNEPGGQNTLPFGISRIQIDIFHETSGTTVSVWDYNPMALTLGTSLASNTKSGFVFNDPNNCTPSAACTETANARGTGLDIVLALPFDVIYSAASAQGLTISGADDLIFRWKEETATAGSDQWVLLNSGFGQRLCTDPLNPACRIVPLPAALPLALTAVGLFGLMGAARRYF